MKKLKPGATSAAIKKLREDKGMSQRAAAEAWGVPVSVVTRFETQEPPPNHPSLVALAKGAGVTLNYFTHGTTAKPLTDDEMKYVNRAMNRAPSGKGKRARNVAAHTAEAAPAVEGTGRRLRSQKATTQTLRTMINTYNVARMQGEAFVKVPSADLHAFLSVVLAQNGVRPEQVLLSADFSQLFG